MTTWLLPCLARPSRACVTQQEQWYQANLRLSLGAGQALLVSKVSDDLPRNAGLRQAKASPNLDVPAVSRRRLASLHFRLFRNDLKLSKAEAAGDEEFRRQQERLYRCAACSL
mmetsp:Transcript_95481/g.169531  ORF Transcript_95481/g.169531 Transcript_95481/m.169531 type:complete len:113 (-) Transcript_95481:106-444(-)